MWNNPDEPVHRKIRGMLGHSGPGMGMSKYKSVPKFKYPNHYIKETEDIW